MPKKTSMRAVVLLCLTSLTALYGATLAASHPAANQTSSWAFRADWNFPQPIQAITVTPTIQCPDIAISTFTLCNKSCDVAHGYSVADISRDITVQITPIPALDIPCRAQPDGGCTICVDWRIECALSCETYCSGSQSSDLECLPHPRQPSIYYCQPRPPGFLDRLFAVPTEPGDQPFCYAHRHTILVSLIAIFTASLVIARIVSRRQPAKIPHQTKRPRLLA